MAHWNISQETSKQIICVRNDGVLDYPFLVELEVAESPLFKQTAKEYIQWTLDNMVSGDTLTVGLTFKE